MKTMHKIVTLILIICLTGLFNTSSFAQLGKKVEEAEKENANKETTEKGGLGDKVEQAEEQAAPAKKGSFHNPEGGGSGGP